MQMWFRVASAKAGKDMLSWSTPDAIRLNLSDEAVAVIERAIASSDPESNSVAKSMGANVSTEIDLPEGSVECLKMQANGAPQVEFVPCDERFVRPNVTASVKGVSLRIWGAEHEAMVRSERIALSQFHARLREARSRHLITTMGQALDADAADAPARKSASPSPL